MKGVPIKRGKTLTSENSTSLLSYDEAFGVIICTGHRYAVQNVTRHLKDYHGGQGDIRRSVVASFSDVQVVPPRLLRDPAPFGPPHPLLESPVEAFRCAEDECGLITPSRDGIRKHCAGDHELSRPGRGPKHAAKPWTTVWAQTFFVGGKQKYFPVQAPKGGGGQEAWQGVDPAQRAELDLIKAEWEARLEARRRELELADESTIKQDRTGWFNRTGWPAHLKSANLHRLVKASRLPDRDEADLGRVAVRVEALLMYSVEGLATLHHETRRWLRSAKMDEADKRPIGKLQNAATHIRYASYMKRFVCYSLRVAERVLAKRSREEEEEEEEEEDDDDDSSSTSSVSLSSPSSSFPSCSASLEPVEQEEGQQQSDPLFDAERLFPWHGDQLTLAARLLDAVRATPTDVAKEAAALQEYLRSFIFQQMWRDTMDGGLVHFLAVLGIDEGGGRLRPGHKFSSMLAGLVYDVRVLAVEMLLPRAQRSEQGQASVQHFLEQRREFLADGCYAPMSHMVSLLAYGKHISFNHYNEGSIDWPSPEMMTFRGERIYMAKFRSMVGRVITEAEDLMWAGLMWCDRRGQRFDIDLDAIDDDVTFTKRGHSFVDKPGNKLDGGLDWMVARMVGPVGGQGLRRGTDWQRHRVRAYLKTVEQFRQLLLFAVHVTGGQPARGPEVLSQRFRNGMLQDRNVYVISGQVVMVTRYHKSQSQWDAPRVIPRFLPWRVGQLVSVYLSYVRPFAELLAVEALGQPCWTDHIWANDQGCCWETDKLSAVISRETSKGLGVRLTTLSYRHAAAGMGRKKVGSAFARGYQDDVDEGEDGEDELEEEAPLELSAGRTTAIGDRAYGVNSGVVKHLSLRSMEIFRPLCEKWHEFMGLRSYAPGRRREKEREKEEGKEKEGGLESVSGKKRGAGWDLSVAPHGPPITDWAAIRDRHFNIGQDHAWAAAAATGSMAGSVPDGSGEEEGRLRRAMCKAIGREAVVFRSEEQAEAMKAVMAKETPLVVVLPTGGGKSILFMAPACMEGDAGMTIVVVPFRQLIRSFIYKAATCGIECEEWEPDTTDPVRLMVVSADKVADYSFLDFGNRMRAKGHLRRVFVDECHLAFTAHRWRVALAQLRKVRALGVPTTFLTATLPPGMEYDFEDSMGLRHARYIRAATNKPNTRYYVHSCRRDGLMAEVEEACLRRARHFRPGEKGVVYCRRVAETEALAARLDCGFVHAHADNNDRTISAWLSKGGLITATSALGTGVDFPGIVFVMHAGTPYGMIDFVQESGRADRDGSGACSVVIVEEDCLDRPPPSGASADEQAMIEYSPHHRLQTARAEQDDGGMAGCDRCGEGEVDVRASERVRAEDREVVEEVMTELEDGCVACWLADAEARRLGGDDGAIEWHHRREGCALAEEKEEEWDEFRATIHFDLSSHSCYRCGFSQKLCRTGVSSEEKCQWPGVVAGVLMEVMETPIGRGIVRRAGFDGMMEADGAEYRKWVRLTHRLRIWGELMSNAMAVVLEFILWVKSLG